MFRFFKDFKKGALSWAIYDWANSAFATTVLAGFFPIFFGAYWGSELTSAESTEYLGYAGSIAGILIAVSAPIIGAFADRGGRRKKYLLLFAFIGIISTAMFYFVAKGDWFTAALFYVLGYMGFLGGDSLYNSLIVDVSDEDTVDFLSGFGFSIGYLGGGVLFAINVMMTLIPESFGLIEAPFMQAAAELDKEVVTLAALKPIIATLSDQFAEVKTTFASATALTPEMKAMVTDEVGAAKALAVKLSFVTVAIWWAFFSLPLVFNVKEQNQEEGVPFLRAVKEGWAQLAHTFREIRKLKVVFLFLLAYWLYIDGVDTIIVMAVKIGQSLGFETADLITALLLVQFIGFPAALLFGWLGQKFGPKPLIMMAIFIYLYVTWLAFTMPEATVGPNGKPIPPPPYDIFGIELSRFFGLAILIGLVQGGVQSLSRSLYATIIPPEKSGEFFGFYNMMGKFAAIIGPFLVAIFTRMTGDSRYGLLSLSILFISGAILLFFVNVKKGQQVAREL